MDFGLPLDGRTVGPMTGDDKLYVEFFEKPVLHKAKSDEAGRPVHVTKTYIRIKTPGSVDEVVRPVKDHDKERFRSRWEAYQRQEQNPVEGTILDEWPPMSRTIAADMKAMGIYTVEQLAGLNDTALQRVGMGGREWKTKAQAFLDATKDGGHAEKLAADLENAQGEIERLKETIAQLAAKIDDDEPKPKRRGRPPRKVA